jgi:hypothetical protein
MIMATTYSKPHVDERRPGDLVEHGGGPTGDRRTSTMRRFFGVVVDPHSYRNIAYLLLGLPLGIAWLTTLVTGVAVGASMLVVALIGIPILLGMWYVTRAFANAERALANVLLHEHLSYAPIESRHHGNLWARLRAMTNERTRRREAGYLLLRFPAGIATFTAAAIALSTPLWIIWAPFHARIVDDTPFGSWSGASHLEDIAMSPWSTLLVPVGMVLLVAALHALNRLAHACGRWTTSALTVEDER